MGRGRAKAKQVKVARQLKYNSGGTDLDRLRAELGVGADQPDRDYDPVGADHDEETTTAGKKTRTTTNGRLLSQRSRTAVGSDMRRPHQHGRTGSSRSAR